MNLDVIKSILELVREHDLAEFELEQDGVKIRIRKAGGQVTFVAPAAPIQAPQPQLTAPAPVAIASAAPVDAPAAETPEPVDLAVIKSPIEGTFYRSSEPGARPFATLLARARPATGRAAHRVGAARQSAAAWPAPSKSCRRPARPRTRGCRRRDRGIGCCRPPARRRCSPRQRRGSHGAGGPGARRGPRP